MGESLEEIFYETQHRLYGGHGGKGKGKSKKEKERAKVALHALLELEPQALDVEVATWSIDDSCRPLAMLGDLNDPGSNVKAPGCH